MTDKNTQYNPHWEAIHDYHDVQRTLLAQQIKDWHKAYPPSSDHQALNALQAELEFHHRTCLHCLDTLQHKTAQDCMNWRVKNATT